MVILSEEKEVELSFEVNDHLIEVEGTYSDKMAEKMKREINMMLYSKDVYNFAFPIGKDQLATPLSSSSRAVLPTGDQYE